MQRGRRSRASCPLRRTGGMTRRMPSLRPQAMRTRTRHAWVAAQRCWARPPPHCLQPGDTHVEDCHHCGMRTGTDGSSPSLSTSWYGLSARGRWAHCLLQNPLRHCRSTRTSALLPSLWVTPAKPLGMVWEHNAPEEAFMVQALREGALTQTKGVIKYRPEFDVVSP